MDVWSLAGPSDRVSGEPLSEVMARGTGLWKRLAASLLNYSEVENIKKRGRLLRKQRVQVRLRSQGDSCLTRLEVVNTVILGSLLGSRMQGKIRGSIQEPCCGSTGREVLTDQIASPQAWSGHAEMTRQYNTIATPQYTQTHTSHSRFFLIWSYHYFASQIIVTLGLKYNKTPI